MKLEEIGFYTLEDRRTKFTSSTSPLWRCELLLTSRCNFNCVYCRKRNTPDISLDEAKKVVDYWASEELKNIRFSGGEPTIHPYLLDLIQYTKSKKSIQRIALSTNGSAEKTFYKELIKSGVNDFSISLDACCSSTGDSIAGRKGSWDHVIKMIEYISRFTYTTVGIVVFDKNQEQLEEIINLAINLGVNDVRIISAAQWNQNLKLNISLLKRWQYPILGYRINNMEKGRNVRGIKISDNHKCPLVLDDMAVENGHHYPCIIYLREKGNPIGKLGKNTRKERERWYQNHNCFEDKICRENCLDVCIDYNNKVRELRGDTQN